MQLPQQLPKLLLCQQQQIDSTIRYYLWHPTASNCHSTHRIVCLLAVMKIIVMQYTISQSEL